jgi:hypothetical protein
VQTATTTIRGSKAIAKELTALGVPAAPITVRRWTDDGPLKGLVHKANGPTSPMLISRRDLERVVQKIKGVTQ